MKEVIYLVPVAFTSKGLPMEYVLRQRPLDKRTNLYKQYAAFITDPMNIISIVANCHEIKLKNNRVILPTRAVAHWFARDLGFCDALSKMDTRKLARYD